MGPNSNVYVYVRWGGDPSNVYVCARFLYIEIYRFLYITKQFLGYQLAGYPTVLINSDTVYQKTESHPQGKD